MKNIVLIGFMGAGKSAVGKLLSEKNKIPFIDTDKLIEKKESKSINDMFKEQGEPYFRKIEKEVIEEISIKEDTIISVGGGAVLDDDNVSNLKKNGLIVYLKAPFDILYDRIKESTSRPLLAVQKPEEEMQALLEARQMAYESVADFTVDVSKGTPEEIAQEIVEHI